MDLGISGKVALVLGAGGGLGGAMATSLANEGVKVALGDINLAAAEANAQGIRENGGEAIAIEWDLAQQDQIDPNMAKIEAELGAIEILINNTGGPKPSTVSGQAPDLWRESFDMMVMSVIAITDRVLPGMKSRGWGRIITSTSSGVVAPIPNLGLSNALRLSLVGWSKTLAREVGKDGITCNIILPGRIATPRISFLDEQKAERENRSVEEVSAESVAAIPVGRYGDPKEYGDTAAFLASNKASYITGSTIRIDGGLIASV
jgi:3-oxoacyl-[acyl-carrier protein] reductase